jgi:hypothetical protein
MSTIRCVYHGTEPKFPATDQHPDAVRYGPLTIDGAVYFVDAIGGAPSDDDIRAALNPPPPLPSQISDRQFFQQLAIAGAISQAEALAAVKTGVIPASLQAVIDALPPDEKFNAEMLLSGATVFARAHPMTEALRAAMGWTSEQTDELWRTAAAL